MVEPPKESCLKCGQHMSVTSLRKHIAGCNKGYMYLVWVKFIVSDRVEVKKTDFLIVDAGPSCNER